MLAPERLRWVDCQKCKSVMGCSMGPYFLKQNKSNQRMQRMMPNLPCWDHTQESCFLEWDPFSRALPASVRELRDTVEPSDQFTANRRHKVDKSFPSCTYNGLDNSGLTLSGSLNGPSSIFHLLQRVTYTELSPHICSTAMGSLPMSEWGMPRHCDEEVT